MEIFTGSEEKKDLVTFWFFRQDIILRKESLNEEFIVK